jgi:hypothetical protein
MRRTLALSLVAASMASIIFVVTGVVLSSVHRKSVERGFDARLSAYVKVLVVNLSSAHRPLEMLPQPIAEPLFDLPFSGWYWQIRALDVSKPDFRSSRSLWDGGLAHLREEDTITSPDGARHGYTIGPMAQSLRLIERTVDLGDDSRYVIAVAGDASEIDDQMRFFNQEIAISLGVLATLLALIIFFQARLARAPSLSVADT